MKIIIKYISFLLVLAGIATPVNAQWRSEVFVLSEGWNAIYTHIDASHTTIELLAQGNEIEQVWMWKPKLSSLQYVQSPDEPINNTSRWVQWSASDPAGSPLKKIIGNTAYLVKASRPLNWVVKGRAVPPRYQWTSTGLNFIGFSTSSSSPPIFSNFLAPVDNFGTGSQIFAYDDPGAVNDTTPSELFTLNTSTVNRGQAYWVRARGYNRYYGPFEIELQDFSGVNFGDSVSSYKIILKNTSKNALTVNMQLVGSEISPEGLDENGVAIPKIKGVIPLMLRGDLLDDSLTFDADYLGAAPTPPKSWVLKPSGEEGSAVEITLGVRWDFMSEGLPGDHYGGLLYFSDSENHLQTIIPVSAVKPDTRGLWVGDANINEVRHGMNIFKESVVDGDATSALNGTLENPLTIFWKKRQAIELLSSEYSPLNKYVESDLGLHLLMKKEYSNINQGDPLIFPSTDENGNFLANPASYWMPRPYHEAFTQGWYFQGAAENPEFVVTDEREEIMMTFVNGSVPEGYQFGIGDHELPFSNIISITESGGLATVTTSISHQFEDGDEVEISGVSGGNANFYNGLFLVESHTADTFTVNVSGSPGPVGDGSTIIGRARDLDYKFYTDDHKRTRSYPLTYLQREMHYKGVEVGDEILPPPLKEDGNGVPSGTTYWESGSLYLVSGNSGYTSNVKAENLTVTWVKTEPQLHDVVHLQKKVVYLNRAVGDVITPPNLDENGEAIAADTVYWKPIGSVLANHVEISEQGIISDIVNSYHTKYSGDITVIWRKQDAENIDVINVIKRDISAGQKLTSNDFQGDLTGDGWSILYPPMKPPFDWAGTIQQDPDGAYSVSYTDNTWGSVSRPLNMRLIVHNNDTQVVNLLQRVYLGLDDARSGWTIATSPDLLPQDGSEVRRVSSVHLPWSNANDPWKFIGSLGKGGVLNTTVTVAHNDLISNPFIHNYHPDHDNLDARFDRKLGQGEESYEIKREIEITLSGSKPGFFGLANAGSVMSGVYQEIFTLGGKPKITGGNDIKQYGMRGKITLRKISSVANLKTE